MSMEKRNGIKKYGFELAVLKFRSRLSVRMLRFYLTATPFEWSLVSNDFYKQWAYDTFNPPQPETN